VEVSTDKVMLVTIGIQAEAWHGMAWHILSGTVTVTCAGDGRSKQSLEGVDILIIRM
jgi:mannose-6-phosphate isomerase-like protein (cupin superfamily)